MTDRLVLDLGPDGMVAAGIEPGGGMYEQVSRVPFAWPLDGRALEDLRWYLEDYLLAPFGVWEDRGPAIRDRLAGWGEQVFAAVLGGGPARDAFQRARDKGLEVVVRSKVPGLLGLPWELMRDGEGPLALRAGGISRSVPVAGKAPMLEVPGGRLRVLMVISRPAGTGDVGYQMVARPLMRRLAAVRGEVDLMVLRPPTFEALHEVVRQSADAGTPFHVVHFDGHGAMPGRVAGGRGIPGSRPSMMTKPGEGVLAFEEPGGGSDLRGASKVAAVLAEGRVPVVVLNACQSGAVSMELEASVATALLNAGCAAVVAMAYSVYAIAAAEFMAAFYESLFTGASVGQAVTAGRRRLLEHDDRPSPKGDMPLADWLVPVHYLRREVRFPDARTARPAAVPSLDEALNQIRATGPESAAVQDPLAPAAGVFVGRDDLFYQFEAAAPSQHVVVLTGPGGTGKTELAKGLARWWRDTGGVDDPRLVLWHSFEPGVATFGLDGVVTQAGLAVFGTGFGLLDPPDQLAQLKRLLSGMRTLLVWDNFESVKEMPDQARATPPLAEDGRELLREFLQWVRDHSASTVIITSRAREDWLGQVHRITVGGLNRTEAAQYAGYLLAPFPAARARRDRRSFGELLDWLDGYPLAMRLTLPRLEDTDPGALLAGLRSTVLPPAAEDAGQGRLSSLGASITYSFAHLAASARRLLPALSLFQGTADVNVLMLFSAVKGVPGQFAEVSRQEWTVVLQDAVRVGLLSEIGGSIYRIHPALPGHLAAAWRNDNPDGYGREREASDHALCAACAAFCQWLTGQIASGNAAPAYAAIGMQRQTLGAMLSHALDHRAWNEAEDIVQALDGYWDTRGFRAEADAWADRILDAIAGPGQEPVAAARSLWLYTVGHQATRQKDAGHPDQAAHTYLQILAWLQGQPATAQTRHVIAVSYHQLGMTAQFRGRLDEAEDWYRKSIAISEELGIRTAMAGTYLHLGITTYERGRLDEAEDWYRKALTVNEELGDRHGVAIAYHELGLTVRRQGRLDEAEDWHRKALEIKGDLGDRSGIARTYHELGATAQQRGRLDEADEWYRKALTIHEGIGDRPNMAAIYHDLGGITHDRGRLDEAEAWYRKSLTIFEEIGDRLGMTSAYHRLGFTARRQGRLDEAEDWCGKSLAISEGIGDQPGMAAIYHEFGAIAQDRGRLDEAEVWYRKSLAIREELRELWGLAMTYTQLGLLAEARQEPHQALDWIIRCVTLFSEFPSPLTGPGPLYLARLARRLGMPALEEAWQRVTGQPPPSAVRDYITSYRDHNDEPGGQP